MVQKDIYETETPAFRNMQDRVVEEVAYIARRIRFPDFSTIWTGKNAVAFPRTIVLPVLHCDSMKLRKRERGNR
jgi:protein gp37